MSKERLDVRIVTLGLVSTRNLAQRVIMAGSVRVNDQIVLKPSEKIENNASITVEKAPKYVSRGGEKLESGLNEFCMLDLSRKKCADIGASTGGFTDCLLQHHAEKVYAIDVGHGELHWKLRNDPRVIVFERTNARYMESLPEKVDLVTIDASFISLKLLLPVAYGILGDFGTIIALIKPQFEAGRKETASGKGVIRNPEIHRRIISEIFEYAISIHLIPIQVIRSPIIGPKGNVEFLALFRNFGKLEFEYKIDDSLFD